MGRTRWANPTAIGQSPNSVWVSKVVQGVKDMPASAGGLRDVGSVPG